MKNDRQLKKKNKKLLRLKVAERVKHDVLIVKTFVRKKNSTEIYIFTISVDSENSQNI